MKNEKEMRALPWLEKAPLSESKVVLESGQINSNLDTTFTEQNKAPGDKTPSDSARNKKEVLVEELRSIRADELPFRRKELAKKYGITSADLQRFWEESRNLLTEKDEELPVWAQDVEKWPEEVDLIEIFELIEKTIRRFFIISEMDATICAVWIVHSWFSAYATYFPILAISAPFEGCAKSSLGDLICQLSYRGFYGFAPSMSSLFRMCDKYSPTFVIDELDQYIKRPAYTDLTHTLNSGVTRGAKVVRTTGENQEGKRDVEFFSVTGPKCIIGIQLPMVLDKTTSSRCIFINLRRATQAELDNVDDFFLNKERPEILELILEIKRKIRRAVEDYHFAFQRRLVSYSDARLTFGLYGRERQKWINGIALTDIGDIKRFAKKNQLKLNEALNIYDQSSASTPIWKERFVKFASIKESEVKLPSEDQELLLQIIKVFKQLHVREISIKELCVQLKRRDRMLYENKLSEIVLGRKLTALGLWRDAKGEPKRPVRKIIKGQKLTVCCLDDVMRVVDGVLDKTEI